ncbi:sensor histidine kinase [Spirillospora sp. CA-253888]
MPQTVAEAMTGRRYLVGMWPWRAAGYLVTSLPAMAGVVLALGTLLLPSALAPSPTTAAASSVLIVLATPPLAAPLARAERRRLRLADARPIEPGDRPAWSWTRYTQGATWREAAYCWLLGTVVPAAYLAVLLVVFLVGILLVSPLLAADSAAPVSLGPTSVDSAGEAAPYALGALAALPAVPYLLGLLAAAHAATARALLTGEDLRAELVEVSRSRARLVDAFEAERRRIERDLHDGAQQRLISLTMQLGLARLDLPPDSPAHAKVGEAHRQAKQLMAELRELIRGIHPRVLTDRGLAAALGELADQSAVRTTVEADVPRLEPHAEGTAYFAAAEALTNVAKHSGAASAHITARWTSGTLALEVRDDGRGGADPAAGTGLTGLADRVAVAGGRMLLSSPPGGPTVLRLEIPCTSE